jgi:hypothetical protein
MNPMTFFQKGQRNLTGGGYQQRIDVTQDEALRKILEQNRVEEKEHACMLPEWSRRAEN